MAAYKITMLYRGEHQATFNIHYRLPKQIFQVNAYTNCCTFVVNIFEEVSVNECNSISALLQACCCRFY